LYCLTLPFCLVQPMGWWSILATVFIAYVMLGIEEIGVEIEDPFGTDANDLPLERICETIAKNLDELRRA
jgi:putative membrane protein